MSIVDDFLNTAHEDVDASMGTESMVCNGQTFPVVWNDFRLEKQGGMGGLEPQVQAVAMAQPSQVTSPKAMIGKRCTIAGESFRVFAVRIGRVAISFEVIDPNESR